MRESKIVLRTTKVPHLLKGRFRDDIALRLKLIFFIALCKCHPEQREGTSFWESKIVLKLRRSLNAKNQNYCFNLGILFGVSIPEIILLALKAMALMVE